MTNGIQKHVRVIAGPTGPTGTHQGVHILAAFTGLTGQFPQWQQISAAQQGTGTTGGAVGASGRYEEIYPIAGTGPAGRIKTVIITGYTGPA